MHVSFPAQKAQLLALGIKVAIAVYEVRCSLQVFLITNGQPIVMADYEGLILLEEHIDGVRLYAVRQQPDIHTSLQRHQADCQYRLQILHVSRSFCIPAL